MSKATDYPKAQSDLEWPEDLIAKHPLTFRLLQDFHCGEGWRAVLTDLCGVIEPILEAMPADETRPSAMQVKEKFGGLRFYMYGSVPEIDAAIEAAEARAIQTCEVCGAAGVLESEHGWITTKCSPCREASRAKMKPQP